MKCLARGWLLLMAILQCSCHAVSYEPSRVRPPELQREFRGLWIATVANIDWPSRRGLSTAAQKTELIALLDRAAQLNLNAVILQVRPACDALYASRIEPWSEYLTGTMGKAPEPFYDPLAFAVEEAHKRGLELHAWFNPYRALHKFHEGPIAANHISKTRPDLVKRHGDYLWLDPGEPDVQEYSLSVVMDVVKRYDIDAVHFDDYFYPDPADGRGAFPDQTSWKKNGAGGNLSFEDWRRDNVDRFIERVNRSIKSAKPWVKFGVSPHGIWRPGNPPQIKGSDNFSKLFADSRKWLMNGWLDYFSPQLYWTIGSKDQSFPVLLRWWQEQNIRQRHLWPGLSAAYALSQNWPETEISNQIAITRQRDGVTGYVIYSSSKLFANSRLSANLKNNTLKEKSLVPASPWLGKTLPGKPVVTVTGTPSALKLSWKASSTNAVRWWVIQTKAYSDWRTEIVFGDIRSRELNLAPEVIAITAIDAAGNAGAPQVLQPRKATSSPRIPQSRK